MTKYIFSDLNVRVKEISESTETMLYDTKVVVQSIWRLLTTQEGEIPNFRSYGLSIKRFSQYPLTRETASEVYEYVKEKIRAYEGRADVIQAEADANFSEGYISLSLIIKVKSTGELVKLPTWNVQVGNI